MLLFSNLKQPKLLVQMAFRAYFTRLIGMWFGGSLKELFQKFSLPVRCVNSTEIILVPKVSGPENLTQFRPIRLCNFLYKIISKLLVNRLKIFPSSLISSKHSAFIAGRQIQDNSIIAHKVFHYLRRQKNREREECECLKLIW